MEAKIKKHSFLMSKVKAKIKKMFPWITIGTFNLFNREIWLKNTLMKIPSGSRILDAGAGEQAYKRFCQHLNYVAQDFAKYDGKGDNAGIQTGSWDQTDLDIISDITAIPEPDGSFDSIMCVEVFEHLPDPIKAVKEFSRLLKSNGHLILTAPFCSLTHFAPYHFGTGFSKYFYEVNLKQHGFEILELQANGNYFQYIAQEIRRIPVVSQKYSKSKPNIFEKLFLLSILMMLDKFSRKDNGSSELLCFGYHILAKKI